MIEMAGQSHGLFVHFPVALWALATALLALLPWLSPWNPRRLLLGLIGVGCVVGVLALLSGLALRPPEQLLVSPPARNKLLIAFWAVAFWSAVWALIAVRPQVTAPGSFLVWLGPMLAAAGFGSLALLGVTAATVAGYPVPVPLDLAAIGWNPHTTAGAGRLVSVVAVLGILALGVVHALRR